jgi:hypothetical protein
MPPRLRAFILIIVLIAALGLSFAINWPSGDTGTRLRAGFILLCIVFGAVFLLRMLAAPLWTSSDEAPFEAQWDENSFASRPDWQVTLGDSIERLSDRQRG